MNNNAANGPRIDVDYMPVNGDEFKHDGQTRYLPMPKKGTYTVDLDGGNMATRLMYVNKEKEIVRVGIPNMRAHVKGRDTDTGDFGDQQRYAWIDFIEDGIERSWVMGDDALEVVKATAGHIDSLTHTSERYGSPEHVFTAMAALAAAGLPDNAKLKLVTSAPPSLVERVKGQMRDGFMRGYEGKGDGQWKVSLSQWEGRPWRTYTVQDVLVVAEGVGSVYAMQYSLTGQDLRINRANGLPLMQGTVALMDGGAGTFDTILFENGKIQTEGIDTASQKGGGVLTQIIKPLQDKLHGEFRKHGINLTVAPERLERFTRAWVASGCQPEYGDIVFNNRTFKLHNILKGLQDGYTRYWMNRISYLKDEGVDAFLLTEGGLYWVRDALIKRYGDRIGNDILIPGVEPLTHLRPIAYEDLNVYGTLIMAARIARVKAGRG